MLCAAILYGGCGCIKRYVRVLVQAVSERSVSVQPMNSRSEGVEGVRESGSSSSKRAQHHQSTRHFTWATKASTRKVDPPQASPRTAAAELHAPIHRRTFCPLCFDNAARFCSSPWTGCGTPAAEIETSIHDQSLTLNLLLHHPRPLLAMLSSYHSLAVYQALSQVRAQP